MRAQPPKPSRDPNYFRSETRKNDKGEEVEVILGRGVPYVPANPMRAAFEAAEVSRAGAALVNKIVRVVRRMDSKRSRRRAS